MKSKEKQKIILVVAGILLLTILAYIVFDPNNLFRVTYKTNISEAIDTIVKKEFKRPELDKTLYDQKMELLANNPPKATSSVSTSSPQATPKNLWPVKGAYPLSGALLPFNRIIAYYGNFYSTKMGALGEYPADEMLAKLEGEVKAWEQADPSTPVIPAIHYIAVTAQGAPGEDGKYRLRMPDSEIQKALDLAKRLDGIVFLDIQVGLSDFESEITYFEKYLMMENVHLGLDPEFSMKTGKKPGTVIGSMDATDINYATEYLAKIVNENNLPPKILVLHRFTQNMITNYQNIILRPEVQIVMDMDGWGPPANKITTYKSFIYPEPVQFTGFKLFYKNDLRSPSPRLMTPEELLNLRPRPSYIQYQ